MEEKRVNEKLSSISISRTSKGQYSWDIKLYYNEESQDGKDIITKLQELDNEMQKSFKGL